MIMITHDLGIIAEVCDEVSVVYAGQIVGGAGTVKMSPPCTITQKVFSVLFRTLRTARQASRFRA